ncbi:MAG: flagellar biosynthetic protein FliO [Pseudomonadota bacterium]
MTAFFAGIVGETAAPWVTGLVLAIVVLAVLWLLFAAIARYRQGVFVSGGRKNRLQIVDATAVDDRRRIVLVRRDDVEHLLMIGGHNDLVIEQSIGVQTAPEVSNAQEALAVAEPQQRHAEPDQTAEPSATQQTAPTAAATAVGAGATLGVINSAVTQPEPEYENTQMFEQPPADFQEAEIALDDVSIDDIDIEELMPEVHPSPAPVPADTMQAPEPVSVASTETQIVDEPAFEDQKNKAPETGSPVEDNIALEGEMEKLLSELTVQR